MNKKGFTLLEVTLFLAISSALALIVFVSLVPRLRNIRFTQAARGLEDSIDQSFLQSQAGGNARSARVTCEVSGGGITITQTSSGANVGSASNCVRNGRLAVFEANKVTYRTIVSLAAPGSTSCAGSTATGISKIVSTECYRSVVLSDREEQPTIYDYPGSFEQTSLVKALGYIVNPETSEKIYFSATSSDYYGDLRSSSTFSLDDAASTKNEFCYAMGSRSVKFAFNNQSLKPDLKFDEACS